MPEAKTADEFFYKFSFLELFEFETRQIICENVVDTFSLLNIVKTILIFLTYFNFFFKSFNSSYVLKVFIPELMVQFVINFLKKSYAGAESYLASFNKVSEDYLLLKNYFLALLL